MKRIKLNELLKEVCDVMDVEEEAVKSKSRKGDTMEARRVYCYLARKFTRKSHREIANLINRDHATVVHHHKKVTDWQSHGGYLKEEIEEVMDRLKLMAISDERRKLRVKISDLRWQLEQEEKKLEELSY